VKSLDDFLPYVLLDCPGVSDDAALSAVSSAAIEFCEKSLVLQRDHDPVNVVAGRSDYDLDSPISGCLVCKVMKAWFDNRVLVPTGPDDMDDPTIYNPAISGGSGSTPTHYIQKEERVISLWRPPQHDGAQLLTLRVALKPSRAAISVDDVLFEDWADVISSGAKASLQIVPGKTFSNPQMGAFNQGAFVAGINRAIVRGNKGHTRTNLSVRMRQL
jgi:hypothetical protein